MAPTPSGEASTWPSAKRIASTSRANIDPYARPPVAGAHRLGPLPVGVGGEDDLPVGLGAGSKQREQLGEPGQHVGAPFADEEAEVQRHLVVPRAGGVEEAGDLAQPARQLGLHRHVHVLLARGHEDPGLGVSPQGHQAIVDGAGRLGRDDALPGQHGQVGHRADQVLAQQRPVLLQRAGEGQHLGQQARSSGGVGLGDQAPPPWRRLYSWSWSPSKLMKPSAARWSNLSSRP